MHVLAHLSAAQLAAVPLAPTPSLADPAAVADRQACALKDLRAAFADAPLTACTFGVLAAPFGGCAAGTPVARCHTTGGTHLALFPEFTLADGQLAPAITIAATPTTPLRLRAGLGFGPLGSWLLQELCLALGDAVGGKMGSKVAGKVFDMAFDVLFPPANDPGVKQELAALLADLKDFLREMKFENAQDELLNNRLWLRNDYGPARQAQAWGEGFDAKGWYRLLNEKQERMRELTENLKRSIDDTDLAACAFLTRAKATLHAQAYTMRALLVAAQLECRDQLKEDNPTFRNRALENTMHQFLGTHAAESRRLAEALCQGRLAYIGELRRERWHAGTTPGADRQEDPPVGGYQWVWRDAFTSAHAKDPFRTTVVDYAASFADSFKQRDTDAASDRAREQAARSRAERQAAVEQLCTQHLRQPLGAAATAAAALQASYRA